MNFVFISPHFPENFYHFCESLKRNGVNVLGIGDTDYNNLRPELKSSLNEYYRVNSLENYNDVFHAVAYFTYKYGKIDWLESMNEYWLLQDARLRTDFNITSGIRNDQIDFIKYKSEMKALYELAGVKTARYHVVDNYENTKAFIAEVGYPVIVKPARLGSSVGINIALDESSLNEAINEALKYDEKIIVEKVIENLKELNCSVLGDKDLYKPSLIEEVSGKDNILSYEDKYISGGKSKGMASASRKVPADIPKKLTKEIENISVKACKALNTNGIVRIDYLYDTKNDKVYLNEINIIPGSLSFYLWKDMKYKDLLENIIELGIKNYKNKSRKQTSFETNVLQNFNGTKGIKK